MADPTWEESAPVEAGTPNWEDTTAIEIEPPPVQGVTAEQIQARRLTPQQETLRRAALGELDLGPYTGMLGPHREEKAAEAIQFLSSLQEPPISIPRPTGRTTLGKIGAGVVRGAAPLIESVVSPAGLILAGAGGPGAGKVAQYGMRGAFAGIAAKAAKEAWDRARRTKDPQDYTEAIVASAGVPLVLGTPEVAPRQVRPVVPPDVLGRFLPTPPGAPAPRIEPPVIEMASPEAAAASARAMQRRATAAYEPPRLAPPQVPEGPLEPPTVTPEPPPAPPELATWDDFVAHLSRNGTGLETRNQIRAMFADVVPGMSSEAAAKLARDAFGAEWMPGGRPPQAPVGVAPQAPPVAAPAPPAPTPPTPGRLEWMGKPLEEWEKMTSSADLPKGGARVRLARSLGLAEGQDTPARILAAIKKRTGEIRAAAATKPPPPPPEAPGAAPVPVPTPPKPPAAPAAAAEKVTLYTGKGGVGGAGEGGSWFTGNLEKARSYGPDVRAVEVPREVADQAKKAAQQQGQGGDTYFLTREHADKAQPIQAPPAKVTEIPTEETTAAESFAKETGWTFSPSAAVMPTPEELAALSPEKRAQFQAIHQANGWEFTDRRPDSPTKGMTFYTKIGATPEEIRAAYTAHLAKNAPKATSPPAVRPPPGELFAVPQNLDPAQAQRRQIVRALEKLQEEDKSGELFDREISNEELTGLSKEVADALRMDWGEVLEKDQGEMIKLLRDRLGQIEANKIAGKLPLYVPPPPVHAANATMARIGREYKRFEVSRNGPDMLGAVEDLISDFPEDVPASIKDAAIEFRKQIEEGEEDPGYSAAFRDFVNAVERETVRDPMELAKRESALASQIDKAAEAQFKPAAPEKFVAVGFTKGKPLDIPGAKHIGEDRFGGKTYWRIPASSLEEARKRGATLNKDLTDSLIQPSAPKPLATPEEQAAEQARLAAETGEEPPTPPPAPPPAAKEPWQMTKAEWTRHEQRGTARDFTDEKVTEARNEEAKARRSLDDANAKRKSLGNMESIRKVMTDREGALKRNQARRDADKEIESARKEFNKWASRSVGRASHEGYIKRALEAGKPVPPEVLADYPNLKPAAPPAATKPGAPVQPPAAAPPIAPPVTPKDLAIEEQRKAGWDPKWPFVPIDFEVPTFREALEVDPTLSAADKNKMFAAAEKILGHAIERAKPAARPPVAPPPGAPVTAKTETGQPFTDIGPNPPEVVAARAEVQRLEADVKARGEALIAQQRKELDTADQEARRELHAEGMKMARELEEAQNQLLAARGRYTDLRVQASFAPFRGQKPPPPSKPKITAKVLKAQRDTLLSQVDSAIKAAPDTAPEENKITFSVPGDGEWTIRNDKEGLRKFRKLAEEQFPDSVAKGTPSKGPTRGKAMPKAETPEAADLPEIGARAVSEDPARFSIQSAYADGTQIVSTDGRQMLRITTDQAPGTPAEPVRLNDKGKVVPGEGDFPNFNAVLDVRPTLVYGGMKTDELWHIARQAQVFAKSFDKPQQALQLLVNPDKSIGARMEQPGGEIFEHNAQPGARRLGSYDADYLFNAADVARRLGNERVDVYFHSGEYGPIGFVGKNHEHVIMGIRTEGAKQLRDEPSKFLDTARNPVNTRQPLGLGPLRNPEGHLGSGSIETASGKFSVSLEAGEFKVEKYIPKGGAYARPDRWDETGRIGREELAGLKGKARQEAIAKAAGATETERVSSEVVSKLNAEMNKLAKEREGIIAEGQKRQKTSVHVTAPPTTPPPGASFFASPANPLGAPVSPQAVTFHSVFLAPLERLPERTRILWRRFAMQSAPRITAMLRAAGEAGVRLAAAPFVSRTKGEQFAGQVLEGIKEPLFDRKLGEALTEDNLRDLKRSFQDRADEAADPDTFIDDLKQQISELQEIADDGDVDARKAIAGMKRDIERISAYTSEDAQAFQDSADAVTSVIGVQNAWFRTEDEYQAFLRSPAAREAIARHIQLWKEEKDPLYRQANDLDPDLPVQTRGLQTGARVNLKAVMPGEGTATTVGPAARTPLVRQAATLIRKDPFGRPATGAAKSYEVSYRELMANGFGREYPVAKQHEFIRILLDSGKGVLRDRGFESDLMIGGERAQKGGYLMTLRPWAKKWLYVPESIAPEVQSILGLEPSTRLGFASDIGDVLTKLSITGFAEGTTHISNLSIEMLTGLGPTANPMLNALIKSMGRADILWRLPKTLIEGFSNRKAEMLALAEIGAAKRPYGGTIGWFINKIDQGGRLVSADIYKRMAAHGWVPDTETGLREFVNAGAGQYIKALQPGVIRKLRETTIQPFATALHTFNVRGIREMGLGPGAKGTSKFASLALRMDKAGGFIGFVVLLAAINRLVSGSSTGPKGTQLGNVGWIGDDGKIHQFPLARLFGYERGPRAVGALAAIEARRAGLSPGTTALKTVGAVGNTAVSYVAGPLVRFGTVAISGKRPGVPMVQEAPVMPPQDELRPLKMQAAQNILTAAQTASPAVDAVMSWKQGKPGAEIMQRQFGRYTPRTGMAPETYEALPKIIESSEMYKYADYVASRARRLPIDQRADFIVKQFEKDGVQDENWRQAWQIIRRKGVLRYD